MHQKTSKILQIPNLCLFFSLALVVLNNFVNFHNKKWLQNIYWNHAATWLQKLAGDLASLLRSALCSVEHHIFIIMLCNHAHHRNKK
jgi:hypothetical protein